MPKIAEIREIDGETWVRIPKESMGEAGSVTLWNEEEMRSHYNRAVRDAITAVEDLIKAP